MYSKVGFSVLGTWVFVVGSWAEASGSSLDYGEELGQSGLQNRLCNGSSNQLSVEA